MCACHHFWNNNKTLFLKFSKTVKSMFTSMQAFRCNVFSKTTIFRPFKSSLKNETDKEYTCFYTKVNN